MLPKTCGTLWRSSRRKVSIATVGCDANIYIVDIANPIADYAAATIKISYGKTFPTILSKSTETKLY